jgi:hypothetical protein
VHINSGIPNTAFYLAAVALGGYAWEKAGKIWYATLCDSRLHSDAQFQEFANLTADNALHLFGDPEQQAVINAWKQVGIIVVPEVIKIAGPWILHYSWGATGNYAQVTLNFNSDGTFTGAGNGKWVQQDGTLLLSFDTGPAKYAGTVDGNIGTGAMSTYAGLDGVWYLSRQGTTGIIASIAFAALAEVDPAGNPVAKKMEMAAPAATRAPAA